MEEPTIESKALEQKKVMNAILDCVKGFNSDRLRSQLLIKRNFTFKRFESQATNFVSITEPELLELLQYEFGSNLSPDHKKFKSNFDIAMGTLELEGFVSRKIIQDPKTGRDIVQYTFSTSFLQPV